MARLFDDALSQYLSCASPVSAAPFTIACWGRFDDMAAKQYVVQLKNSSNGHWAALQARFEAAFDPINNQVWNGSAWTAENANQITVNTWRFIGATFDSSARWAYANDLRVGNAGDHLPTGPLNQLFIGANAGAGDFTSGRLAELGIWNATLSWTEMIAMSKGWSPLHIRPQSLVFYLPLVRDNDRDLIGGLTVTPTNAPTVANHVPIIYPGMQTMMGSGSGGLAFAAPTNLICSVVSSVQINLSWTDNSDDEVGFKIERSTDNVFWNQIATVGANVTTYSDMGLTPNKTYYYRVRAYK